MNKRAALRGEQGPEHCEKTERWQGPPHVNTVKQYKLCRPLVSLLSHEDKDRV